jgi:nitric oxide reductase large subunit
MLGSLRGHGIYVAPTWAAEIQVCLIFGLGLFSEVNGLRARHSADRTFLW